MTAKTEAKNTSETKAPEKKPPSVSNDMKARINKLVKAVKDRVASDPDDSAYVSALSGLSAGILRIEDKVRKLEGTIKKLESSLAEGTEPRMNSDKALEEESSTDNNEERCSDERLYETLATVVGKFKSEEHGPVIIVCRRYANWGLRVTVDTPEEGILETLSTIMRTPSPNFFLSDPSPTALAAEAFATGFLPLHGTKLTKQDNNLYIPRMVSVQP